MKNEINTIDNLMEIFEDFLKNRGDVYDDGDLKIYKERFLRYQEMSLGNGTEIMQEFQKLPTEEHMCFYMYLRYMFGNGKAPLFVQISETELKDIYKDDNN